MEPEEVTYFESPSAFRKWLRRHHAKRDVLWVGYWKKATSRPSITWEESVDEALCFGWIDGIRKKVDEESYTIRFTPRRPGSVWSKRNIARYQELKKAGLVERSGADAFAAKVSEKSGVYSFEQDRPMRLAGAYLKKLKSNESAWADWRSRPPGYRRQVTHWIMSAKRKTTRERRLTALIEDSAAGRKVKPLRP